MNSLARIWKVPVRKKRPPFCKVKSWQKKRTSEMQLKMMDRIMTAWTAWIHSARGGGGRRRRVLSIKDPTSKSIIST